MINYTSLQAMFVDVLKKKNENIYNQKNAWIT